MKRRLQERLAELYFKGDIEAVRKSAVQEGAEPFTGSGLIQQGLIDDHQLAECIAWDLGKKPLVRPPYWEDPEWAGRFDDQILAGFYCFPLGLEGNRLRAAFVDPYNLEAVEYLKKVTGKPVQREVVALGDFSLVMEQKLKERSQDQPLGVPGQGGKPEEPEPLEFLRLDGEVGDDGRLRGGAEGKGVIRLINEAIGWAIEKGASDIHIEPSATGVKIRMRIDGTLREYQSYPRAYHNAVTSRLKLLADLDIAEHRKPQDGRFAVRFRRVKTDLRLSCLPSAAGEKLVLRVLSDETAPLSLEGMGFRKETCQKLNRIFHLPQGIFLVTGPTGSGKSTTLRAGLKIITSPHLNIITVENPIEYQMPGINQVQVNDKAGLTFAAVLRSILRQDPNVIMVGEIRDAETAEIAFKAAATGHLVLSTLHTVDAVSAISRLRGLQVPGDILAATLTGVLAQRLVRRACSFCREFVRGERQVDALAQLHLPSNTLSVIPVGCYQCGLTGYKGRKALEELLLVSNPLRQAIERGEAPTVLEALAQREGMTTLLESGAMAVMDKEVPCEEVLRIAGDRTLIRHLSLEGKGSDEKTSIQPTAPWVVQKETAVPALIPPEPLQPKSLLPTPPSALQTPTIGGRNGEEENEPTCGNPRSWKGPQPPLKILIVDEDPQSRQVLVHQIQALGYFTEVCECDGPEGALGYLEETEVVLTEVLFHGMDGFEFLDRIRENPKTAVLPVVITTSLPEERGKRRALLGGGDGYLLKPIPPEAFGHIFRRMVKRVRPNLTLAAPAGTK